LNNKSEMIAKIWDKMRVCVWCVCVVRWRCPVWWRHGQQAPMPASRPRLGVSASTDAPSWSEDRQDRQPKESQGLNKRLWGQGKRVWTISLNAQDVHYGKTRWEGQASHRLSPNATAGQWRVRGAPDGDVQPAEFRHVVPPVIENAFPAPQTTCNTPDNHT